MWWKTIWNSYALVKTNNQIVKILSAWLVKLFVNVKTTLKLAKSEDNI